METRVPCVLHVLFARLLACEINLRARVRVACKNTCKDINLLQVCTVVPLLIISKLLLSLPEVLQILPFRLKNLY